MTDEERPIRIQIPEELGFSQEEIDSLELAFRTRLLDVQDEVTLDATPVESINTTRFAVEVEVVAPLRRLTGATPPGGEQGSTKKASAKKGGGKSSKKSSKKPTK